MDARCRHLKVGRLSVVSLLSELPPTQHDPQSFCVDLTLFSSQLILLTVTGVFKERTSNENNLLLRSFQRTLIIVPSGSGFCIRNEMLHINNATYTQEKKAFKPLLPSVPVPQPVVTSSPAQTIPHPALPSTSTVGLDEQTKIQMVQAMSQQSNMNIEWSTKYVYFI